MNNFEKRFNRRRKLTRTFFVINITIIVIVFGVMALLGIYAITNPEGIGEFFGKIVNGFKDAL